jgi:PAS domain-containing protein
VQVEQSVAGVGRHGRDFLRNKFPLRDERDRIYAIAGVATDITERKASEREIADLSAFLQAMIDRIPNPMFYNGPDTRFLGCNRATRRRSGSRGTASDRQARGRSGSAPPLGRGTPRLPSNMERIVADGSTMQTEAIVPFADGTPTTRLFSISAFRKPDGSRAAWLASSSTSSR